MPVLGLNTQGWSDKSLTAVREEPSIQEGVSAASRRRVSDRVQNLNTNNQQQPEAHEKRRQVDGDVAEWR